MSFDSKTKDNVKVAQKLWATYDLYPGAIDGLIGPLSRKAIAGAMRRWGSEYTFVANSANFERQFIASVQAILDAMGHEPGVIDGYYGHNTAGALESYAYKELHGEPLRYRRNMSPGIKLKTDPSSLPTQSEMGKFYGTPGKSTGTVRHNLKTVELPYTMVADWATDVLITRVTLHQKCVDSFIQAQKSIVEHYGLDKWKSLGLNRYAGGYNPRKMRHGSKWSTHAYGCAVDIYAAPNGLRTRCPDALFCNPEYEAFLDIMEALGWLPAIRLWGADAMHFQQARL